MPKSQFTPDELKAAIKALKIDVPGLAYWKEGSPSGAGGTGLAIVLVLLGGKKVTYNPKSK